MKPRICIIPIIFFLSLSIFATESKTNDLSDTINKVFKGQVASKLSLKSVPKDHPDYAITSILRAIQYDRKGQFQKVIGILSPLQVQLKVTPLFKGLGDKRELMVGTYRGFRLWRELTYLLLGRSYYSLGDYENAIRSFQGVPRASPFYTFASLELFWSHVGNSSYNKAIEVHQTGMKLSFSPRQSLEYQIQSAFIASHSGKYKSAMEIAYSVASNKLTSNPVKLAAFKVFAESGFLYWNREYLKLSFEDSVSILRRVLDFSRSIPPKYCDSECSFFVAEGWWNFASIHRVQDPVKYKTIVDRALSSSNTAIAPHVTNSVKSGRAILSEDAYFLSIVLAWEMGNPQVAIARSKYFDEFYPVGRYQEDVYQLLGDHYFEKKKFKEALTYYRALVKIGGTEKSTYGTYKASWSFYNLGQKWSALRHLEQILLEVHKSNRPELENLSILKESRRDLLLFMAELLGFKQALPELKYIGFSGSKLSLALEDLGVTYKKIGRFSHSSQVFQYLLDQSLSSGEAHPRFSKWLQELLDNKLREREFVVLDKLLRKYYLAYKELVGSPLPFDDNFYEYISSTFLLIHREAKKTDELSTWKSLDSLYYFAGNHFYHKSSFQLLYHGAQRFESIDDFESAIKWYKSGASKKDPLASDSAISALRIAKTIADRSSLNPKDYATYDRLVQDTAEWFLTNYQELPQRHIADLLYIESLLKLEEFDMINHFYTDIFTRDGATKFNISKLKKIQSKLYDQKKWSEVFFLTKLLFEHQNIAGITRRFRSKLRLVMQEAAFQNGFGISNRDLAIPWYQTAIDINESLETTLRAWNNVLLLFSDKDPFNVIISRFNRFEKLVGSLDSSKLSFESSDLIYKTRLRVSSLLLKQNFLFLGHRIEFMARNGRSDFSIERRRFLNEVFLRFNSSYGDSNKFSGKNDHEILRHLQLVSGGTNRWEFKSYRWNEPLAIINYIDSYHQNSTDKSETIAQTSSSYLKNRPELQGVLSDLYEFNSDDYSLKVSELSNELKDSDVIPTIQEHDKMFTALISQLRPLLKSPSPRVQVQAICHIGHIRGKSATFYKRLKEIVTTKFKDWQELQAGLTTKTATIFKSSVKELRKCEEAKQQLSSYYPIVPNPKRPLYSSTEIRKYSVEEGEILYREAMSNYTNPLDRIHYLLSEGAVAIAELLAYSLSKNERNIALALIRIKLGDLRGAVSLAKLSKSALSKAIQAIVMKSNGGNPAKYIESIDLNDDFPIFLKDIIEELK